MVKLGDIIEKVVSDMILRSSRRIVPDFVPNSEFNNGIGKLDSFPSIMKPQLKNNINWEIDLINGLGFGFNIDSNKENIKL